VRELVVGHGQRALDDAAQVLFDRCWFCDVGGTIFALTIMPSSSIS